MTEIIIASDIHIAKVWNTISENLENEKHINPNQNFDNLVSSIESNQILVLNGDLVDCYYQEYFKLEKSNWDLFFESLSKCKGKYYCNLGNHEYRKRAYNLNIHGLKHLGISRELQKKIRGIYSKFRYFKELDSIRSIHKNFDPFLNYPFDKNYVVRNSFDLLLLNTGRDEHWFKLKNWRFFKPNFAPRTLGLGKNRITYLKEILETTNKTVIIFIHAPVIFSLAPIKPTSRLNKLKHGTFKKYRQEFINILKKSNKNIIIINGHTHISKQYILDKESGLIRDSSIDEINDIFYDTNSVKFISNYALGSIEKACKQTGYLKIKPGHIEYHIIDDFTSEEPEIHGTQSHKV